MGLGRYRDGKFDLIVVANYLMTPEDWIEWERSLKKSSEILYNASEGQLQFGRLYVCDENIGGGIADIILHAADGLSGSYFRTFGRAGFGIDLMAPIKQDALITLHELGHYVWGLGEEYTGVPIDDDMIDRTSPIRDFSIIPVRGLGLPDDFLVEINARVMLNFYRDPDTIFEERQVTANTATTVTADAPFSDYTINAAEIWYTIPAECASDPTANYCIMEACHRERGSFDEIGVWQDIPNPLTEFCTPGNHDPDRNTHHENTYGKSCWEVILDHPDFATLAMPDPGGAGPTVGWTEPEWIVLDKQPRFALVLDRSGSMEHGHKMAEARNGAMYWLEFSLATGEMLTVIWYDHEITRIVELTDAPDLEAVRAAIAALEPRGTTNIRDALFEALDQIQTRPTRAAVQVALLLTDGKHNTPLGSNAAEVIPDFQEAGVRIYALGVGEPDAVDMAVLDELAEGTGGSAYEVGDDDSGLVEAAMDEIRVELQGGIITTIPALFPALRARAFPGLEVPLSGKMGPDRRPAWRGLLKMLKIKEAKEVIRPPERLRKRVKAIPAMVEAQCRRASFTLVYPEDHNLWLYLIDPDGQPVDMSSAGVYHGISRAPHEFALVENPKPGRWHMVAVRPEAGGAFRFRAIAGGENPGLHVLGGASSSQDNLGPVRLWATARWGQTLSNLRVGVTITTPQGTKRRLLMTDVRDEEPDSGVYETYYWPEQPGRYNGLIEILNPGGARLARAGHLMSHTTERSISLKSAAHRFVRQVRFTFYAGSRPEVQDIEQAQGVTAKYQKFRPRPMKLESAQAFGADKKLGRRGGDTGL